MHYEANAFSSNGKLTIVATKNATAVLGQRVGMSPIDILEVQRYYGCVPTLNATTSTLGSSTLSSSSAHVRCTGVFDPSVSSSGLFAHFGIKSFSSLH